MALTTEQNEQLTRTGPGTLLGDLFRRYWIPAILAEEVAEKDGAPVRVQLLGEKLVAFRDTDGRLGVIGEFCAHRGVSLWFGRNEECGLRCPYHGWKYDVNGQCIDLPSEAEASGMRSRIKLKSYPSIEQGGVIWIYMGPPELKPEPPALEWTLVPAENRYVSKRLQESNYLQAIEGGIDSSHVSFLHSGALNRDPLFKGGQERANRYNLTDRMPHFDVVEYEGGLLIGARRQADNDRWYWRITQYLLPFYTMPPADLDERIFQSHIWVPMDDTHVVNWMVTWHTERPLTQDEIAIHQAGKGAHVCDYAPATSEPYGDVRTAASRDNDYFMDWEAHRTRMFCGIPGFGVQDQAIQESQGPTAIVDRSQEHLGTSDSAIIQVRRRLLAAARALREHAAPPPGQDPASYSVRPTSALLPPGADWVSAAMGRIAVRPGQSLTRV